MIPCPILAAPKAATYQPCVTGNANDLGCLVDNILSATTPAIIGFGEIHHNGTNNRSTLEQFTTEALPLLPRYQVRDLVLELLFSDPQIESELAAYHNYRTDLNHQQTPGLYRIIQTPAYKGVSQLLAACRRLGIVVHPGGPTTQEFNDPAIQAEIKTNGTWPKTVQLYGQSLERSMLQVIRCGRRVASYSGIRHNDLDGTAQTGSFGPRFSRICGQRYVEIDLVSRQRLNDTLHPLNPTQVDYTSKLYYYENNASAARNVTLNPRSSQYAIILK